MNKGKRGCLGFIMIIKITERFQKNRKIVISLLSSVRSFPIPTRLSADFIPNFTDKSNPLKPWKKKKEDENRSEGRYKARPNFVQWITTNRVVQNHPLWVQAKSNKAPNRGWKLHAAGFSSGKLGKIFLDEKGFDWNRLRRRLSCLTSLVLFTLFHWEASKLPELRIYILYLHFRWI